MRKTLSLTVTHNCNLSCVYCYEHEKDLSIMKVSVAKDALHKNLIESKDEHEEIVIDFGGGEPLLAFDMIRELCEWTWEQKWPIPYTFFATTNGTVLTHKMKEWFRKNNEKISLCLSLDGTPNMHNENRSNSYKQIDTKFFLVNWPNQPIKMTVSNQTLPYLFEGIKYVHNLGFKINVNLANGIDWNNEQNKEIYSNQLSKLVSYYLNNPSIEVCSMLNVNYHSLLSTDKKNKWCGVGTNMVAIDIDGANYPCHMFEPLSIGKKSKNINEIDFHDLSKLIDVRCKDCIVYPVCPTCYGLNLFYNDNIAKRDESLCELTKLRVLAVLKLEANKLLQQDDNLITNDQRNSVLSIEYIYKKLLFPVVQLNN